MGILDDVLEFIFELIFEGTLEAGSKKKAPFLLRMFIAVTVLAIWGYFTLSIFNIGYDYLLEDNISGAIIFFIITTLMVIAGFIYVKNPYNDDKKGNNNDNHFETDYNKSETYDIATTYKKNTINACIITCIWVCVGICVFFFTDLFK